MNIGWLDNEEACLARIEQSASEGRCIAWIRNSIDDAVRIYRQLLARGAIPAEKISLFHSRFAFMTVSELRRKPYRTSARTTARSGRVGC